MVKCDLNSIKKGLMQLEDKDYENAIDLFSKIEKSANKSNAVDKISIALSLLGLSKYLLDKNNYNESLKSLHDAKYMILKLQKLK